MRPFLRIVVIGPKSSSAELQLFSYRLALSRHFESVRN
jgi:hypothetical protein